MLVAVGVALFLINPHSLASWIVGGIGIILFIVNFVNSFFPEVQAWSDLVWPTILVIIGVLLLYRYYQTPSPKPPAQAQPPKQEDGEGKPEEPPKAASPECRVPKKGLRVARRRLLVQSPPTPQTFYACTVHPVFFGA